jgi:hypothetical protein
MHVPQSRVDLTLNASRRGDQQGIPPSVFAVALEDVSTSGRMKLCVTAIVPKAHRTIGIAT